MKSVLPALLLCLAANAFASGQETSLSLATVPEVSRNIVMITAHRGGYDKHAQRGAPENSLAAIDRAVQLGVDFVETDLRRSKDGQFVVFHDPTLKRTTGAAGRVEDKTLDELRTLHLLYQDGSRSDQRIPTLREFLLQAQDRVFIKFDFKVSLEYLQEAVEEVAAAGSLNQVMFALKWYEHPGPQIHKLLDAGMPYTPELFMFRVNNVRELDEVLANFDISFIDVRMKSKAITKEKRTAIEKAHSRGLVVATHAWGNEETWDELAAAGVQVLQTRFAQKMTHHLQKDNRLRLANCLPTAVPPKECWPD